METENRVALLALIVRDGASVAALNELLHQYGDYIIGRMGLPCPSGMSTSSASPWTRPET